MRNLRWLSFRLMTLLRRRARDRDLDAELRFHLETDTESALEEGRHVEDAERAARHGLGNVTRLKEDAREVWTWPSLERLAQDLRYAIRVLRRRPVFAATALLSLALGIGANTALFSIMDNLLLKALPVGRPHELLKLVDRGETVVPSTYDRLREGAGSLQVALMTLARGPEGIDRSGMKRQAVVQMVSDNYFDLLGVPAIRGSVFHDSSNPWPEPVAVITHDYWMRAYGGDSVALGDRFRLGQYQYTIIGVTAEGFHGASIDQPVDVWVRFEQVVPPGDEDRTRGRWVSVLGRLRPGHSLAAAEAESSAILGRPVRWLPGASGFSTLRGTLSRPLLLLGLVAGLVLLIICANLASLALAGSSARERELAVRSAIGASRARVIRQLTTESIVLSLGGAGLALVVAPWTSAALLAFLPPAEMPTLRNLGFVLDLRLLTFVVLISVLITILFGLLPAFSATRAGVAPALKAGRDEGRRSRSWTSRGLVVVEVALCTLLLVVAGVFVRTVQNLREQDSGYLEDRLLVADVQPPFEYPEARRDALIEELRVLSESLPGVEVAAFSNAGQLSGRGLEYGVALPGEPFPPTSAERVVFEHRVSPAFLRAMGTQFVAGRDIAAEDDERSRPVAVVNEEFVRQVFRGADPLGRTFVREQVTAGPVETLVVGVVRDSKWVNLRDDYPAMYYIPYRQKGGIPAVRFVIRASGDVAALGAQFVQMAQSLEPQMALTNVVPFREIVDRTLVIERLVAHVSTAFALLGLLVACVGLYGLLAYAVLRRRREIGVRIAIGATPGTVVWMMVRESLALLLAGIVIGVPGAILVTRAVSSLLFGLAPHDPGVVAGTVATLALATLAATWGPARRAAGIDPTRALRED